MTDDDFDKWLEQMNRNSDAAAAALLVAGGMFLAVLFFLAGYLIWGQP